MPGHGLATTTTLLESVVLVEYKRLRFVFSSMPPPMLIPAWAKRLVELDVGLLVRVSEEQPYTQKDMGDIKLVEFPLTDGCVPDKEQSAAWIELSNRFFKVNPGKALAVHCTAGLGRSPMLVGICLINARLDAFDAIELLRSKRRGVLNSKQAAFLLDFKRRRKAACVVL